MANKIQLDKIKEEIKSRREQSNVVPQHLGENVNSLSGSPRDEFLNGLVTSLKTGSATPATNLVREVHNTVVDKKGGDTKHSTHTPTPAPSNRPTQGSRPSKPNMSPERDEQMFKDFEKMKGSTLAESIENFSGGRGGAGNSSPTVDFNGQQYLTSPPSGAGNKGAPQQLNEGVLVESVKSIVNEHLTENLGPVFEEAIKNTVIEMYAVERIQEVLKENKDLIKSVVVETIKEIRDRSKSKAE